jgi:hypothetical protein
MPRTLPIHLSKGLKSRYNGESIGSENSSGGSMAKIPWSRIREAFDGQWVELTECVWHHNSLQPAAGRVRFHSSSRASLLEKIAHAGPKEGSVILFVGPAVPVVQMHDGRYDFSAGY